MKKKIFLLSILLLLILLALSNKAFANTDIGYWTDEGNFDINWYIEDDDYKTEEGDGIYYISNERELAGLSAITNGVVNVDTTKLEGMGKETKTIVINNNMDLSAHYWVPIKRLRIIELDGNYKTISNVTSVEKTGFINWYEGGICSIKNMNISCNYEIEIIENNILYGGLVNRLSTGSIENVNIEVNMKLTNKNSDISKKSMFVGGLVGCNGGWEGIYSINNCSVKGNINLDLENKDTVMVGGVLGCLEYYHIINSSSSVDINAKLLNNSNVKIGGITAGANESNNPLAVTILNTYNTGNISVTSEENQVQGKLDIGGILGYGDSFSVTNSYNIGNISVEGIEYFNEKNIGYITSNDLDGEYMGKYVNNYYLENIESKDFIINNYGGINEINVEKLNDISLIEDILYEIGYSPSKLKKWIVDENENNGFPILSEEYSDVKLRTIKRIDINFDKNILGKKQSDIEITIKTDPENLATQQDGAWQYETTYINSSDGKEYMTWHTLEEESKFVRNKKYRFLTNIYRDPNYIFDESLEVYVNGEKIDYNSYYKYYPNRYSISIDYTIDTSLLAPLKGDLNNDGSTTLYDAFTMLRKIIISDELSDEETYIMDYNDDNNITLYDAFSFLRQIILA